MKMNFKRSAGRSQSANQGYFHPRVKPLESETRHSQGQDSLPCGLPGHNRDNRDNRDKRISVVISFSITDSTIKNNVRELQRGMRMPKGAERQLIPIRGLHMCLVMPVWVSESTLPR